MVGVGMKTFTVMDCETYGKEIKVSLDGKGVIEIEIGGSDGEFAELSKSAAVIFANKLLELSE